MATRAECSLSGDAKQPATALKDGPVAGALLPLVRSNGQLFVLDNCLHFFPAMTLPPSATVITDQSSA